MPLSNTCHFTERQSDAWLRPVSSFLQYFSSYSSWLLGGYSQIFRLYVFGPSGLKDYGSAMLRCKMWSLPFLGLRPTRPPPWHNPRKGRDHILPSGNTVTIPPTTPNVKSPLSSHRVTNSLGIQVSISPHRCLHKIRAPRILSHMCLFATKIKFIFGPLLVIFSPFLWVVEPQSGLVICGRLEPPKKKRFICDTVVVLADANDLVMSSHISSKSDSWFFKNLHLEVW